MSDREDRKRAWRRFGRWVLGLVLGWVVLVGVETQVGNAAGIGMTLNRDQVLRSCVGNADKRCGYLVFFSLVTLPVWPANRPERPGLINSTDLFSKLPPPLASAVYTSMQMYPGNCPEEALEKFITDSRSPAKSPDIQLGRIVAIPENLGRCFQASPSQKEEYFLLVIDRKIPGYYVCEPDFQRSLLCQIYLSRIVRINGKMREERLNISSFSLREMRELIGNFPRFSVEPRGDLEEQFLSTLSWARSLLGNVNTQTRAER